MMNGAMLTALACGSLSSAQERMNDVEPFDVGRESRVSDRQDKFRWKWMNGLRALRIHGAHSGFGVVETIFLSASRNASIAR